ncbi:MAG: hypothetical protein A2Y40_01185 [Candidatus Margulisbacteria bacterium GWF2_35_9]|nr:MAG: hypothetical protein A2Y40_01185 [Candidatus Margulisbacteria bacterium GWF2_35_9]
MVFHLCFKEQTLKKQVFINLSLIFCSLSIGATVIELPTAIEKALANKYGLYYETHVNKTQSELDHELYKDSKEWKFNFDIKRKLIENSQLDMSNNYIDSYDYNSNANLNGSWQTAFIFGSTFYSSIGLTYTRNKEIVNRKPYNLYTTIETSLTQPLFPDAIYYQSTEDESYLNNIKAYELNQIKTMESVVLDTINKYLSLYLIQKKLEQEQIQYELKKELATDVHNLMQFGKKTALDYDQITIEVLQSESKLSTLKRQVLEKEQSFNILIGESLNTNLTLKSPDIQSSAITKSIINQIISSNYSIDVKLIDIQLNINKRAIAKIAADYGPKFTASSQHSWNNDADTSDSIIDNHNNRNYLYTLAINIPIANQKEIEHTRHKLDIEKGLLISKKIKQKLDYSLYIADLYQSYLETQKNIQILLRSINLQEKNIRIRQIQYKAGSILLRDLIEDQNQLKSSLIEMEEQKANQFIIYFRFMMELNGIDYCLKNELKTNTIKGGINNEPTS